MNEGELTTKTAFLSLDGVLVSLVNSAYQEVALLGVCSTPAMWEVEVNGRWKILSMELATWLENQWQHERIKASLHDQIEASFISFTFQGPILTAVSVRDKNMKQNCNFNFNFHPKVDVKKFSF